MTEAVATGATADSPPSSARLDDSDPPWPLRPWIMAAICAVAGLAFHLLIDHHYDDALAHWRSALAAGVAAATVVFVLGVERRRWHWALGFALGWGVILRSEEHTSELQSLMRISYAVFCLKKKKRTQT